MISVLICTWRHGLTLALATSAVTLLVLTVEDLIGSRRRSRESP